MSQHNQHKEIVHDLSKALYDFDSDEVLTTLKAKLSEQCIAHYFHPVGTLHGAQAVFDNVFQPLHVAIPDLERRDYMLIAGADEDQNHWVGCGGFYCGTLTRPWLGIPPTGHFITLRFHEFYRFEEGQIVEIQAIWDVPDVMRQADAWPLAPSLGREIHIPGPATCDGIVTTAYSEERSLKTRQLIIDMLVAMSRHPSQGGPEVMQLEQFWHPKMSWYGPSGIGTCRGINGFRQWHQIPFLKAMPDRGQYPDEVKHHFFADEQYAAVTGWPNMSQTITGDGWLGIPPLNQKVYMRSLDFWRVENHLIRENWVLVDLLDMYRQIGVDVLGRMTELHPISAF